MGYPPESISLIYWNFTAVQNRVLVYMLLHKLLHVLSNFGNVETRISIFLLVGEGGGGGILFIVKIFKGNIFISNICHIPLRIK